MTNVKDQGCILWFTGLSGAGKSTLAEYLTPILRECGKKVEILDGDEVRENLSKGLGFSKEDRDTNIRRIGFVADLLARNGVIAITAAISPYREIRDENRKRSKAPFVEIYVEAPLAVVEERDTKGLYKKARAGIIKQFTGISDPYEEPLHPEVTVHTGTESIEESAKKILAYLESKHIVPAGSAAKAH
ncbi:MAG: adenylyl-sulfate kinase [Planctomycetes bacterium]|nr:adenylyl-sulfate kinase [Planctomycetota bacterium]